LIVGEAAVGGTTTVAVVVAVVGAAHGVGAILAEDAVVFLGRVVSDGPPRAVLPNPKRITNNDAAKATQAVVKTLVRGG